MVYRVHYGTDYETWCEPCRKMCTRKTHTIHCEELHTKVIAINDENNPAQSKTARTTLEAWSSYHSVPLMDNIQYLATFLTP